MVSSKKGPSSGSGLSKIASTVSSPSVNNALRRQIHGPECRTPPGQIRFCSSRVRRISGIKQGCESDPRPLETPPRSSARITPRLPDKPSGFNTQGYSAERAASATDPFGSEAESIRVPEDQPLERLRGQGTCPGRQRQHPVDETAHPSSAAVRAAISSRSVPYRDNSVRLVRRTAARVAAASAGFSKRTQAPDRPTDRRVDRSGRRQNDLQAHALCGALPIRVSDNRSWTATSRTRLRHHKQAGYSSRSGVEMDAALLEVRDVAEVRGLCRPVTDPDIAVRTLTDCCTQSRKFSTWSIVWSRWDFTITGSGLPFA